MLVFTYRFQSTPQIRFSLLNLESFFSIFHSQIPIHLIISIFPDHSLSIGFPNTIFHFQIPSQRKKLPLHDFSWKRQPSYNHINFLHSVEPMLVSALLPQACIHGRLNLFLQAFLLHAVSHFLLASGQFLLSTPK